MNIFTAVKFHKTGDRLIIPDFIRELQKQNKKYNYQHREYQYRNITDIRYRDCWATYNIPKPIEKKKIVRKKKSKKKD